jgi:hypothetical protein
MQCVINTLIAKNRLMRTKRGTYKRVPQQIEMPLPDPVKNDIQLQSYLTREFAAMRADIRNMHNTFNALYKELTGHNPHTES